VWAAICGLVKAFWTDAQITDALLDPANGISAHVLDQGNPQQYAQRQVQRSREAVARGAAAPMAQEPSWPELAAEAYHGLAGRVVELVALHSEADPVAILLHYLTEVGNAIGRHGYYVVEADRHHTNVFALLVGAASKARKGTAAGRSRQILEIIDPDWANKCVHSGLSTGEGLIWHVRDEVSELVWQGKGANRRQVLQVTDPGVEDKRY
jgi:hypothetical protein